MGYLMLKRAGVLTLAVISILYYKAPKKTAFELALIEGPDVNYKFKLGNNITLSCMDKQDFKNPANITWIKDSKKVSDIPYLYNRYVINEREASITILSGQSTDIGNYLCGFDNNPTNYKLFAVESFIILSMPRKVYCFPDYDAKIPCNYDNNNNEDVHIIWEKNSETINFENSAKYDVVENLHINVKTLVIKNFEMTDIGNYTCKAINQRKLLKVVVKGEFSTASTQLVLGNGLSSEIQVIIILIMEVLTIWGLAVIRKLRDNNSA